MQHVGQDFTVISLDDTAQLTVIQTRNHLNAVFVSESDRMKLGSSLAVEVIDASCQELQGLPLVSWQRSAPPHQNSDPKGLRFGQTVKGTVKSVKPTAITLTLEGGTVGSVHVSEVKDASQLCPGTFPTSSVKVGSVVTARVIGGREASSHRLAPSRLFLTAGFVFCSRLIGPQFDCSCLSSRYLPFSHPRFTYTIPELTLMPR